MSHFVVHDPRRNADFRLKSDYPDRTRFSSLTRNLLVIEAEGVDWTSLSSLLDEAFEASGKEGFIWFRPWLPGVEAKQAAFQSAFSTAIKLTVDPLPFVVSDGRHIASEALALRDSIGGSRSGVWICGGAESSEAVHRSFVDAGALTEPTPFLAAAAIQHIGGALSIDEGGSTTLFLHLSSKRIEALADRCIAALWASADKGRFAAGQNRGSRISSR